MPLTDYLLVMFSAAHFDSPSEAPRVREKALADFLIPIDPLYAARPYIDGSTGDDDCLLMILVVDDF